MTKQLFILSLAFLSIGFSFLSAEAQDTDQERIQGLWEIVSVTDSGEVDEDEAGKRVRFEGDQFIPIDEEDQAEDIEFSFELNDSAMPPHFDMILEFNLGEDPPEEVRMLGIYELDGDSLILCLSNPFTGKETARPTEFESPQDSDISLIQLVRVVEEE